METTPNENWNLVQLAEFCVKILRRTTKDAWLIGTALNLAKEKHKGTRDFCKWLVDIVEIGKSTAYRYMEIANRLTLSESESLSFKEIYRRIEGEKAAEDPKETVDERDLSHEGQTTPVNETIPEPSTTGKWWEADDDEAEFDEPSEDELNGECLQITDDLLMISRDVNRYVDLDFDTGLKPKQRAKLLDAVEVMEKATGRLKAALKPIEKDKAA